MPVFLYFWYYAYGISWFMIGLGVWAPLKNLEAKMELNAYGQKWVNSHLAKIDEDKVYASIGSYDPEAFAKYLEIRKEELVKIAIEHQDDPEFQCRNQPQA